MTQNRQIVVKGKPWWRSDKALLAVVILSGWILCRHCENQMKAADHLPSRRDSPQLLLRDIEDLEVRLADERELRLQSQEDLVDLRRCVEDCVFFGEDCLSCL
ncbi:MAG TPA: hypothetical protein VMX18_01055 [Candidatus Bipolaricaulota bacterium]|nr:hypothetical protein [Candidatus Bipolaricaulota bacterium]